MVDKEEMATFTYLPTIVELMEKCKRDYADYPAISDKTTTYTYKELYERVGKRRNFIAKQNLPEGSKIAVMARNDLDAMELLLAIATAGHTYIMLPNALGEEALVGISMKFKLAGMFVAEEFMPLAENLTCKVWPTSSIGDEEEPAAQVTKDTIAAIYFTGGTTGAPKGAVLTHGAMMRGAFNGVFQPGKVKHKRYIAMLPLSHIFGSVKSFLACLYTGSLVYTCTDMRAAVGDIPVVRPHVLVLVPGLVEIIFNIASMRGKEFLGDLETLVVGAAPVPPRLMKIAQDMGICLCAGYGLTEAANLSFASCETDKYPNSMGKAYPKQEYKVVDGELWLKGDNLMLGYYNEPEKTAEVMEDGWLKTGDLVEFDDKGYIYITGRIKNLIILPNGENVSPEELEELFYKKTEVRDCLVSEMDFNGRQVIGIEILPFMPAFAGMNKEDIQKKMQEITNEINKELPTYKRILKVVVRDEDFKRTGAMKIARNQ
ncbi:MAG: acyl--CoA ligase [Lachnospiraceae bacterium]|nr:acyl--CoA ligase [Lachnospiraceae bacterium]